MGGAGIQRTTPWGHQAIDVRAVTFAGYCPVEPVLRIESLWSLPGPKARYRTLQNKMATKVPNHKVERKAIRSAFSCAVKWMLKRWS